MSAAALIFVVPPVVLAADEVGRRIEISTIERLSGAAAGPDIPSEQMPAPRVDFREIEFRSGKKKLSAETAYLESEDKGFAMPADISNFDLRCSGRDRVRMPAIIKIRELAKLSRGILPERYNETMEKISKLSSAVEALPGSSLNDLRAIASLLNVEAASAPFIEELCSGSKQARRYLDIAGGYPVEPLSGRARRANIEKVREIVNVRLKRIAANDSVRKNIIEKNNKAVEEGRKKLEDIINFIHAGRGREEIDSFNLAISARHEEILNFMRYNYYQFMQIGDTESARKIFDCRVVNGKCEFSGEFMNEYDGLPASLEFKYSRRDGFGGTKMRSMPVEQFKYKRSFDSMLGAYCLEESRTNEFMSADERAGSETRIKLCMKLLGSRGNAPEVSDGDDPSTGGAGEL